MHCAIAFSACYVLLIILLSISSAHALCLPQLCFLIFRLTLHHALQAGFTSLAHTDADVEHTIEAARETFAEI